MKHRDSVEPDDRGIRLANFIMEMDFDALLDHDIDSLNDTACWAWGSDDLQDINYEPCGYKDGMLLVRVEGWEQEEE